MENTRGIYEAVRASLRRLVNSMVVFKLTIADAAAVEMMLQIMDRFSVKPSDFGFEQPQMPKSERRIAAYLANEVSQKMGFK